jgi:hypothetical protein
MGARQNLDIAARLEEVADLLEEQGASTFRVRAYRRGADAVRALGRPVAELLASGGLPGLVALPAIGESLARAIESLVRTGRLPHLDRLRGEGDPVALLSSVPGLGKVLAERLHETLGIDSLADLEAAAHDGRLAGLAGFGARRVKGIREALAGRLGRVRAARPGAVVPVATLLDVDAEYRRRAKAGTLPRIAPRRFNPEKVAWLPILHTTRGKRHYTALFSNTARAHQLGRTDDWVVIYYDGGGAEGQCTVVTARDGGLRGRRVIRAREGECAEYYTRARDR